MTAGLRTSPSTRVRSKNIEYIAGVDHIRAFASLLVVFHHSFWMLRSRLQPPGLVVDNWKFTDNLFYSLVIETHIVVTLFFVLSGFVFTLAGDGKHIRYGQFMRNRLLRVMPLYLTLIFFGMATFPDRITVAGFLSTATILGNTLTGLNLYPLSTTFWTVAVELQFYLIFPFLNEFINKEGAKPILYLLLFAIALRLCGFLLTNSMRDLTYWHLPGRIDAFLVGMLAARVYARRGWHVLSAWWLLPATLAVFTTTYALNQLGGYPAQTWWKALWPTLEAVVCTGFVLAYLAASQRLPRLLSRAISYLGELSFSTYLVHFMILHAFILHGFLLDFRGMFGWGHQGWAAGNTLVVIIPATLGLSFLSYQGLEAPFMRLRGRYVSDERQGAKVT